MQNRGPAKNSSLGLMVAMGAVLLGAVQQASASGTTVDQLRDRVELAYQAGDLAGIEDARRGLLAAAADAGQSGQAAYYAAFARLRQGLAAEAEPATARGYIDDCIAELKALVDREPGNAEARAMLGSCYGISTLYHKLSIPTRGLEARRQIAAAREIAPGNPWVMLQDGLADFETPRLFGGDREAGIDKLEKASALFAAAARAGSRPATWAAAEVWQQLGRMYEATGRIEQARFALDRAQVFLVEGRAPAAPQMAATL
jgi:tetratricopeptide (TPR) repeat protein